MLKAGKVLPIVCFVARESVVHSPQAVLFFDRRYGIEQQRKHCCGLSCAIGPRNRDKSLLGLGKFQIALGKTVQPFLDPLFRLGLVLRRLLLSSERENAAHRKQNCGHRENRTLQYHCTTSAVVLVPAW